MSLCPSNSKMRLVSLTSCNFVFAYSMWKNMLRKMNWVLEGLMGGSLPCVNTESPLLNGSAARLTKHNELPCTEHRRQTSSWEVLTFPWTPSMGFKFCVCVFLIIFVLRTFGEFAAFPVFLGIIVQITECSVSEPWHIKNSFGYISDFLLIVLR